MADLGSGKPRQLPPLHPTPLELLHHLWELEGGILGLRDSEIVNLTDDGLAFWKNGRELGRVFFKEDGQISTYPDIVPAPIRKDRLDPTEIRRWVGLALLKEAPK